AREIKVVNTQINQTAVSKQDQEEYERALAEDRTAFMYDEVYDSMKAAEKRELSLTHNVEQEREKANRELKDILLAASRRQREFLRIQERKAQRELEAEGEELRTTERFITSAYQAQLEELKQLEEEEKRLEQMDAQGQRNLTHFYRDLLERHSSVKEAAIRASRETPASASSIPVSVESDDTEKTDRELAEQARAAGKRVDLNEDEEIIDKRQLLSAGLNVGTKRPLSQLQSNSSKPGGSFFTRTSRETNRTLQARQEEVRRREKQQQELQRQIREKERKEREEEKTKEEELLKKFAKKNDEKAVSDARARYLARKNKGKD
ncbi:792_t:CDS:2, partial [Paraglomus occultum]